MHHFLNNILMQLRKTTNHPVLIRTFYDDNTINEMAKILKETSPTYENVTLLDVEKDLKSYSDWQLHCIAVHNEKLSQFQLKREQWTESSGKLLELKKNY